MRLFHAQNLSVTKSILRLQNELFFVAHEETKKALRNPEPFIFALKIGGNFDAFEKISVRDRRH